MRKFYLALFSFICISLFSTDLYSQTVTIGTGTSTQRFPLNYWYGYGRSAMIYTAAEMGTTSSDLMITSIAFNCGTAANTGPTVIYMNQVGATTAESSVTWAAKITGAISVYSGTPSNDVGWRTITLTTPFIVNANQNLEVMVECNYGGTGNGSSSGNSVSYSTVTNGHQYWQADNSAPTGSGTTSSSRPNIQIVFTTPPSCTVPPAGGTVSGPSSPVCQGSSFTLSVTGDAAGLGLSYQWESSPDNSAWTPIAGQTSAGLTTTQTTSTYYRRKITCSGNDAYSTTIQVMNQISIVSTLPWTENFDGLSTLGATSFPCGWTKENGDWRSANNATSLFDADARSAPNFIEDAYSATNEFIWSPGFVLTAGTLYNFSFWYADYDGSTSWSAEVYSNTSPNSAGASQLDTAFLSIGTPAPTVYTEVKRSFSPSASGTYYFGIRVNADSAPWYLSFDDFKLEEVPAADVGATAITAPSITCPSPAASNLQASFKNFGASDIDMSVNPVTVTVNVTGAATATLTGTINSGILPVGGTTSVSLTPAFAFSNSGTYNFSVTATTASDGNNANDTYVSFKVINTVPVVDLGPDVDACANNGILLSPGTQPSGSAYLWSTNATTPTITVTSSGTYNVTVTSPPLNGPGKKKFSSSASVAIIDLQTVNSTQTVSGLLNTSMTATSVDSVCINLTHTWDSDMDIQLVSPNGTVMDLSIGNGGSGDNYTNTCFTASASSSISSGSAPFTGTYLPEGSFSSFAAGNPNGSWSLRVTDNFTGDQGTINSWYVVFNDSLPAAGTGCPDSASINVIVKPEPVVNLGPDAVVCQGGTKTLDPGNQPSGSTFLWNTGATSQTIVAGTTGTYWVEVTNSAGCFKRDSINVTVAAPTPTTLNLPFDTLYVNSPIQSLGGGSPGGTGGVYSGSGISGTVINPAAFTQGNHQVTYTYTDQYGCVSTANDVFTVIGSSTADKVNIFPNPSQNGNLKLIVAEDLIGGMVTAYNAYGQKMQSWVIGGRLSELTLNWPAGRYILVIRNNGEEVQKQLIITR